MSSSRVRGVSLAANPLARPARPTSPMNISLDVRIRRLDALREGGAIDIPFRRRSRLGLTHQNAHRGAALFTARASAYAAEDALCVSFWTREVALAVSRTRIVRYQSDALNGMRHRRVAIQSRNTTLTRSHSSPRAASGTLRPASPSRKCANRTIRASRVRRMPSGCGHQPRRSTRSAGLGRRLKCPIAAFADTGCSWATGWTFRQGGSFNRVRQP